MVFNQLAAHLLKQNNQEVAAVKVITGRRGVLLTNHLVGGTVLIPGAAGTLPELQQVGFHYAT
jgi:hypothetical protein